MSAEVERYTVRGRAEETACDWCGFPLYSGDVAYLIEESDVACCRDHADRWIEYMCRCRRERQEVAS